jgi:hypothetical protein
MKDQPRVETISFAANSESDWLLLHQGRCLPVNSFNYIFPLDGHCKIKADMYSFQYIRTGEWHLNDLLDKFKLVVFNRGIGGIGVYYNGQYVCCNSLDDKTDILNTYIDMYITANKASISRGSFLEVGISTRDPELANKLTEIRKDNKWLSVIQYS